MAAITDIRFQHALLSTANHNGKLYDQHVKFRLSGRNTPERLQSALAPLRLDGTLPDYPLGSDFTPVEQRLVRALTWLKANTATRAMKLKTIVRALTTAPAYDHDAIARMGYSRPTSMHERFYARLLSLALLSTGG